MRKTIAKSATAVLLFSTLSALPALATTHPKPKHTPTPTVRHSAPKKTAAAAHRDGMAPERATEIQTALIKQGYMSGEPSGAWDGESAAAMQKFQADNGWQTKFTPDSRALNKLGLGSNSTTTTDSQ